MAALTNSGHEQKGKASQSKLSYFFTLKKRYKSVSNLDEEVQPRETTQGPSTSTDSKHQKSGFDPTWQKDLIPLTNRHNVAVNMEAQLGLTAVDGGFKGA